MVMRNKLWTTFDGLVNLSAAGQAGNKGVKIGQNLIVGLDLSHLAGYTIGPTFLDIIIHNDDDNVSSSTEIAHVGIMIGQGGLDDGDFPNLALGDGDYYLRRALLFDGGAANSVLVKPDEAALVSITSRSSRRLERIGDTIWLVFQQTTANDYDYDFSVTMMVMMP